MIIELSPNILENLSKTELEIVNFINDNEERLSELSIVDIAFEAYTSLIDEKGRIITQNEV